MSENTLERVAELAAMASCSVTNILGFKVINFLKVSLVAENIDQAFFQQNDTKKKICLCNQQILLKIK